LINIAIWLHVHLHSLDTVGDCKTGFRRLELSWHIGVVIDVDHVDEPTVGRHPLVGDSFGALVTTEGVVQVQCHSSTALLVLVVGLASCSGVGVDLDTVDIEIGRQLVPVHDDAKIPASHDGRNGYELSR